MKTTLNISQKLAISLTLFTGLNALIAGFLFIIDPSGDKLGLSVAYLQSSPFTSYLIPGLTLFTVIGIGNLITTFVRMSISDTLG